MDGFANGAKLVLILCFGIFAFAASGSEEEKAGDTVSSTDPLTVESALQEALTRSPDVKRAQASVDEKKWQRFKAVGEGFLPKVTLSGLHYFDTNYTITNINFGGAVLSFPGFYPNSALEVDATLPIFNGLSNVRNLQAASFMVDATEQELSQSQFQLSQEVRLAFFQALAAAQLKDVAEENVKTLEDHLRQVKIQRHGGVATNYDTLRVEVQLNEARADAIDAEDNATLTRKKLSVLLGFQDDNRPLQGTLPEPDTERVKGLEFTHIPQERFDIQALNYRAQAADRLQSALAGAWLSPSVYLSGQYQIYDQQVFNNVIFNTGRYQDAYNVGIFVKWNLFDGGVSYAESREAIYRAVQAEKASDLAKLQVPYDFNYWKRRYLSNSDHYQTKKFDITRSEEAVRLAKEEERAGTRTSTETLDAELDLFRARAGVVNAMVKAAEAQIRLELALGRRI